MAAPAMFMSRAFAGVRALFGARTAPPARSFGLRRFDAAAVDRLTASWQAGNIAIDSDLKSCLDRLRARSRDLFKNNEFAAKFGRMVRNNVVGADGFILQMQVRDPGRGMDSGANAAIEDAFARWSQPAVCDVAGKRSFSDFCRAAALALARDGEFLIRRRFGPDFGPFGFQLQMLDIDRLDTTYNIAPANGRNAVIMGVELDVYRRPVAYWLWDRHSMDYAAPRQTRERVAASEILHGFIPVEDEQTRGIPWMHAVMRRMNDLNGYREAAIIAARVGASKMGFYTSPDGQPGTPAEGTDRPGEFISEATPGHFDVLPQGYGFTPFDPDYPHAQFDMFCKATLRGIASGLGVPYHELGNDLEGVNYSSIRAGTLASRDEWVLVQQWLIDTLLEPVFDDWLPIALAANRIVLANGAPLPLAKATKFQPHRWQGRRWQWVDPLKDMTANVLAIENGLDSPQQVAARQGRDVEDVVNELAEFQQLLKAKGVVLTGTTAPTGALASAAASDDAGAQSTPRK